MKRAVGLLTVLIAAAGSVGDERRDFINLAARRQTSVQESRTVVENGIAKTITVTRTAPVEVTIAIDPAKTAVVVCDMWDDHWCKSASARCAELAKAADPVLKACRDKGMTIVHCPSDCMDFYKDHPARKRLLAMKKVDPPKGKDLPNPPLPVDDSDGGCDDEKPAKQFKAWTRQHAAIAINDDKDYITDSGSEVFSLMAEKKIDTLIVMGVHTNMCAEPRAIKQMVKWGRASISFVI